MKPIEMIQSIRTFNEDVDIMVEVHNKLYDFNIAWSGGGEGAGKDRARFVHLVVDRLNSNEEAIK